MKERIEFQDMSGKTLGYVESDGKKLKGTNPKLQNFADSWLADIPGRSADDFLSHFQDWNSGYLFTKLVA